MSGVGVDVEGLVGVVLLMGSLVLVVMGFLEVAVILLLSVLGFVLAVMSLFSVESWFMYQ